MERSLPDNRRDPAARRAVITGSSRGLGKALLQHFRNRGWDVAGFARTGEECLGDVNDPASVQHFMSAFCEPAGGDPGLDLLVCCASNAFGGRFEDVPPHEVASALAADATGAMVAVRTALPFLRQRPGSSVVLINSFAGFAGVPGFAAYSAAKASVDAFAQAIRMEMEGNDPAILQLFLGALEEDAQSVRTAWTQDGKTQLRPMRTLRLFPGASTPIATVDVAETIEGALGQSRDIYLPRSLALMHAMARHSPRLFRRLVRSFYQRRVPEMLGEGGAARHRDSDRPA